MRFHFTVLLVAFLLTGCTGQPLTPEEQHLVEIQRYCQGVAKGQQWEELSKNEQSEVPEVDEDDPLWQHMTAGSDSSTNYDAAYSECMKKNLPK